MDIIQCIVRLLSRDIIVRTLSLEFSNSSIRAGFSSFVFSRYLHTLITGLSPYLIKIPTTSALKGMSS